MSHCSHVDTGSAFIFADGILQDCHVPTGCKIYILWDNCFHCVMVPFHDRLATWITFCTFIFFFLPFFLFWTSDEMRKVVDHLEDTKIRICDPLMLLLMFQPTVWKFSLIKIWYSIQFKLILSFEKSIIPFISTLFIGQFCRSFFWRRFCWKRCWCIRRRRK